MKADANHLPPDGRAGPGGAFALLPSQGIEALAEAGGVASDAPFVAGQIQPASLDLRLGDWAWRIRASFLPGAGVRVADRLADFGLHRIDLSGGAVLETGCVYIAPLMERLALPPGISAAANPKSSTGRLDVFTRVIADGARSFDAIADGYAGPLYAEICPQTFPILARMGSRLTQIRFRRSVPDMPHAPPALPPVTLSVDLSGAGTDGIAGYRAKRHTGVVDIDRAGACAIADFWEPVLPGRERRLILDPDQFYILASKEAVETPPTHAAEMAPFDALVGEFRVHYAGFFDPGFGHASSGGAGSRAVLEVRSHKVPFILEHGQIVGRLVYEPLTEPPRALYGAGLGSHYQAQGLKLSKHFR